MESIAAGMKRMQALPALLVFLSAGVVKIVLCETAGLHFPPSSGPPGSTVYEPIPSTAEQTPDRRETSS